MLFGQVRRQLDGFGQGVQIQSPVGPSYHRITYPLDNIPVIGKDPVYLFSPVDRSGMAGNHMFRYQSSHGVQRFYPCIHRPRAGSPDGVKVWKAPVESDIRSTLGAPTMSRQWTSKISGVGMESIFPAISSSFSQADKNGKERSSPIIRDNLITKESLWRLPIKARFGQAPDTKAGDGKKAPGQELGL